MDALASTMAERLAGFPGVRNRILAARYRVMLWEMMGAAASNRPSRIRTRLQRLFTQAVSYFGRYHRRYSTRFAGVPIRQMELSEVFVLLEPVLWGISYACVPSDNDDELVPSEYVWGLLNGTVRAAFPSTLERNSAIYLAGLFLGYHVHDDIDRVVQLYAVRVW